MEAIDDSAAGVRRPPVRRPPVVIVAAGMLALGSALLMGEVLLSMDKYFTGMHVYEQAASDGLIEHHGGFAAIGATVHLLPGLLGAVIGFGLMVLAPFNGFGHNWARAVSWILGTPVLLWYGALAIVNVLLSAVPEPSGADVVPPELTRRFEQEWPGWLDSLDTGLVVLVPLALLCALVCQTVPTADAYFRLRRR